MRSLSAYQHMDIEISRWKGIMSRSDNPGRCALAQPLTLPCGVVLKNRIVKAAMSDSLGDGRGNPTRDQIRLYQRWADGGAALSILGEAQVSGDFPEKPGNLVLTPGVDKVSLRALAQAGSGNRAQIWPQLGHAGALSYVPISRPKGPSPLRFEQLTCDGMTPADIQAVPGLYATAAGLAKEAGFKGVEIHAAHGFLFSQFLSPVFNHRTDTYGGSVANRFRVIHETIAAVRDAVGSGFAVGIKINATDRLVGGLSEEDALDVVRCLDKTSVDLIDISGGTYFPGAPSTSEKASAQGPYFAAFAKQAKSVTTIPIMLTGGFRTRAQANEALLDGTADLIGLARALVLDPSLPQAWLGREDKDPAFPVFDAPPPGSLTAWYSMRLTALGRDAEDKFCTAPAEALRAYDARDEDRARDWKRRFGP